MRYLSPSVCVIYSCTSPLPRWPVPVSLLLLLAHFLWRAPHRRCPLRPAAWVPCLVSSDVLCAVCYVWQSPWPFCFLTRAHSCLQPLLDLTTQMIFIFLLTLRFTQLHYPRAIAAYPLSPLTNGAQPRAHPPLSALR